MSRLVYNSVFGVFKWLAAKAIGGPPVQVALDDDVLLTLSVARGVEPFVERADRSRYINLVVSRDVPSQETIFPPLARLAEALGGNIERCLCHLDDSPEGPVWQLRTNMRTTNDRRQAARAVPVDDCGRPGLTVWDVWFAALPLLCWEAKGLAWDRMTASGFPPPYPLHPRGLVVPSATQSRVVSEWEPCCPHANVELTCPIGSLDATGDGYVFKVDGRYGAERSRGPIRCYRCHEGETHSLDPRIWDPAGPAIGVATAKFYGLAAFRLREVVEMLMPVRTITLTSWTLGMKSSLALIPTLSCPTIVMVETQEDAEAVEAFVAAEPLEPVGAASVARRRLLPLVVPVMGTGRSLGNLRVVMGATVRCDVAVHIVDVRLKSAGVVDRASVPDVAYAHVLTHLGAPCADMGLMRPGRSLAALEFPLCRFLVWADVWGLEEAILDRYWECVAVSSAANASFDLEWGVPLRLQRKGTFRTVTANAVPQWHSARGGSRLAILTTYREAVRPAFGAGFTTSVDSVLVLPYRLCDPVDPGVLSHPVRAPFDHGPITTAQAALGARLGRITWYVLGSRGDVVPILPLAQQLRRHGITVDVVRCHSEEEGLQMLRWLETGKVLRGAPIFARTWMNAAMTAGIVVGPPELPNLDVSISLRPPATVARPADFKAGIALNWVLNNVLRNETNLWNVGSYPGLYWLPRSQDGVSFLRASKVPNAGRPVRIAIDMGSSSIEAPVIPGAVTLPKPYTFEDLERVQVLVGHGGAGSVQAAAAANVTYVSVSDALDRAYLDPLNCGAGTMTGQDPDKVLLMLLEVDPAVLYYTYRVGWRLFILAVWTLLRRRGGTLAWLAFVALYQVWRSPGIAFTASSLLNAAVSVVLSMGLPPVLAQLLAPHVVSTVSFVVDWSGAAWVDVLFIGLRTLIMVTGCTEFWVAYTVTGSSALAFLVGFVRWQFLPIVPGINFVMGIVGAVVEEDPAYMGISFAWPSIPVPLFHVRFFNGAKTRRYEGNWGGPIGGMYQPYTVRVGRWKYDLPNEWVLRTSIPWSHFEQTKAMTAPYSVLWNCQSSAVVATWSVWSGLGVGGFVLLPSMAWAVVAWLVATTVALALLFLLQVVPLLYVVMEAAGLVHYIKPLRSVCFTVLARLTDPRHPVFTRVMHALVGVNVAWGAPDMGDLGRVYSEMMEIAAAHPPSEHRADLLRAVLRSCELVNASHVLSELFMAFADLHAPEDVTDRQ